MDSKPNSRTGDRKRTGQQTTDGSEAGHVLFDTNGGVITRADLGVVSGNSPVRVRTKPTVVELEINISAGDVTAELTADRAEQLGTALHEAAAELREREAAEADE